MHANKTILIIDDIIPAPYLGSGFPRAYSLLKMLSGLGYRVTFFPTAPLEPFPTATFALITKKEKAYVEEFKQLGVEIMRGKNREDFVDFCKNRKKYYDLVIISRPHNMTFVYDAIKTYFSNAKIIYDAEALFAEREILMKKIKGECLSEEEEKKLIQEEVSLADKADLIMIVSERDKDKLNEFGNKKKIISWGNPVDIKRTNNNFLERKDLLFVGGFLGGPNCPNEDAIEYFAKEMFPEVSKILRCKLFIVGFSPTNAVKNLASEDIFVEGYVDDITPYYDKCKVFIVPHRYSAGIPFKVAEAMAFGIPSVVSELTALQLGLKDGRESLVAKNNKEFIRKVVELYTDKNLWHEIRENAFNYITKESDPVRLKNKLRSIIDGILDGT